MTTSPVSSTASLNVVAVADDTFTLAAMSVRPSAFVVMKLNLSVPPTIPPKVVTPAPDEFAVSENVLPLEESSVEPNVMS